MAPDAYVHGAPRIVDGRIAELVDPPARSGSLVAVAGLRNCHSHLDLSLVRGVPRATAGFAQWLLDLLRQRSPFDAEQIRQGVTAGAAAVLASGTTAVGDIDSSGWAASAVAKAGLAGVSFREVLGTRSPDTALNGLRQWLTDFPAAAGGGVLRPGVSPHAPYSTPALVYRNAVDLARYQRLAVSTHIAETMAEAQLLCDGTGELSELLCQLGVPPAFEEAPGMSPLAYLDSLGALGPDVGLAHANYPSGEDLVRIRASGATVIYCPRSHNFFGHTPHPVRQYLDAGISVALGTDSRASNASLSLFDELAFLRAARPDLTPAELWHMATCAGARFLEGASGTLHVGERADLCLVEWRGGLPGSLAEALDGVTSGAGPVVATVVSGVLCHLRGAPTTGPVPLTGPVAELLSSGFA